MEFRRVLFRSEADSGVLRHEGVALLPEWLERLAKPGLVDADAVVFHRCQRVAAFGARAAGHAAAALGVLDGVGDAVDERLAGEAAVAPGEAAVAVVLEGDLLLVGQWLQQAADVREDLAEIAGFLLRLPGARLHPRKVEKGRK